MRRIAVGLMAVLCSPFSVLVAQQPRELQLGRPTATFPGEFSLINGLRELRDGSVLVADPTDAKLRELDPALKTATMVGTIGSGPGEYRQPDAVWPLPGDSTLLVDLGNNRLVRVGPDLGFGTYSPIMAQSGPGNFQMMMVGGVDAGGRLYFRGMPTPGGGNDSLPVNRARTDGSDVQVVARLKGPDTRTTTSGGANNRSQSTRQVPLSPTDGWAVSPSGLVYVVRAGDYHVDVVTPTGRVIHGAPVAYTPVKITDAEKQEFVAESQRQGGLSIGVSNENGQVSFQMGRAAPRANDFDNLPWPDVKPPFDAGDLWVDSLERLWVRREEPAGAPVRYDIFTPDGARAATVTVSGNRRVVGMGRQTVYLARFDDSDLQYLERYDLPM